MLYNRSLDQFTEEYFVNHPDEVGDFITECFEEYALDGDSSSLLAQLRVIAKVKGVTKIAKEAGISRQGLQKALSSKGNPRFDNINSIVQSMGYHLTLERNTSA